MTLNTLTCAIITQCYNDTAHIFTKTHRTLAHMQLLTDDGHLEISSTIVTFRHIIDCEKQSFSQHHFKQHSTWDIVTLWIFVFIVLGHFVHAVLTREFQLTLSDKPSDRNQFVWCLDWESPKTFDINNPQIRCELPGICFFWWQASSISTTS